MKEFEKALVEADKGAERQFKSLLEAYDAAARAASQRQLDWAIKDVTRQANKAIADYYDSMETLFKIWGSVMALLSMLAGSAGCVFAFLGYRLSREKHPHELAKFEREAAASVVTLS